MRSVREVLLLIIEKLSALVSAAPGERIWKGRALVFAPHPDDEVLGCGGTIARKVRAGCDVRIVIVTDGRASHSRLMDAQQLVNLRRQEAMDAAAALGLPAGCCSVLGFPDQELARHHEQAVAIVSSLIREFEPEEIYVPHTADRIDDHIATNRIVMAALEQFAAPVTVMEYPVWLWHTWPWIAGFEPRKFRSILLDMWRLAIGCRTRVDIAEVRGVKLQALSAHRTQMTRMHDNPDWLTLGDVGGGQFLPRLTREYEVFRRSRVYHGSN
jgi:LmbE family N-acetylglucosaminyl deacetylase